MLGHSPILVILVKVTETVQHNNGFTSSTECSSNLCSTTAELKGAVEIVPALNNTCEGTACTS